MPRRAWWPSSPRRSTRSSWRRTCAAARPTWKDAAEPMSAPDPQSASARAFVALQYLLPQHLLTDSFVGGYHPDMSDAAQPDARAYESFNAFFTRALRPGARPWDADRK